MTMTVGVSGQTAVGSAALDLRLLARLHDREVDEVLLQELAGSPARDWLSIALSSDGADSGFSLIDSFLAQTRECKQAAVVEELAADFADIYLTFGKRVAPDESYWLTEDHIERQGPMFDVREWYTHHGLKAPDWRMRADDHLVHEMEFVAFLLESGSVVASADAGRFLDQHLLRWSGDFFSGVAARASTPFYAGLALVTQALLLSVRTLIEGVTGVARATPSPPQPTLPPSEAEHAFLPGIQPGW